MHWDEMHRVGSLQCLGSLVPVIRSRCSVILSNARAGGALAEFFVLCWQAHVRGCLP